MSSQPSPDKISCPTCGDSFDTTDGMKIHHATIHDESIAGQKVDCSYCGQELRRKPSHIERNDNFFCEDKQCYQNWQSENIVGVNHHQFDRVTVECNWCKSEIERRKCEIESSERQFCNHQCYSKWLSENLNGNKHPTWEGGKIETNCDWCGEVIYRKPSEYEKNKQKFCNLDCLGKWRSENIVGKRHHNWKKGSAHIYSAVKGYIGDYCWQKRRNELQKIHNECYKCGTTDDIEMHHIIPVLSGGTNEDWNIMPLCTSCHRTIEQYTKNFTKHHITK